MIVQQGVKMIETEKTVDGGRVSLTRQMSRGEYAKINPKRTITSLDHSEKAGVDNPYLELPKQVHKSVSHAQIHKSSVRN